MLNDRVASLFFHENNPRAMVEGAMGYLLKFVMLNFKP